MPTSASRSCTPSQDPADCAHTPTETGKYPSRATQPSRPLARPGSAETDPSRPGPRRHRAADVRTSQNRRLERADPRRDQDSDCITATSMGSPCVQGGARRQGAGRFRDRAGPARQGRGSPPPPRARPHPLCPEIRLAGGAGRRRCARGRGPRPGRGGDARLVREERRRDPHEGPGDRPHGSHRQPEDGHRHLPPRHLTQSRSGASYPCGHRQHGPGRGRQVALDGERAALSIQDAARRALPERARAGARASSDTASRRPMPTDGSRSRASAARSWKPSRRDAGRSRRRLPGAAAERPPTTSASPSARP